MGVLTEVFDVGGGGGGGVGGRGGGDGGAAGRYRHLHFPHNCLGLFGPMAIPHHVQYHSSSS